MSAPRAGRRRFRSSLVARGEPMLWLTGGALVLCLVMIGGLLLWVAGSGLATFWPRPLLQIEAHDGQHWLGEVSASETFRPEPGLLERLPAADAERARAVLARSGGLATRRLLRIGNYELTGAHYQWVEEWRVARESHPPQAATVERLDWGRFYGTPQAWVRVAPLPLAAAGPAELALAAQRVPPEPGKSVQVLVRRLSGGQPRELLVAPDAVAAPDTVLGLAEVWSGGAAAWSRLESELPRVHELRRRKRALERGPLAAASERLEAARLALREAELEHHPPASWMATHMAITGARAAADAAEVERLTERLQAIERDLGGPPAALLARVAELDAETSAARDDYAATEREIDSLDRELRRQRVLLATAQGQDVLLALADIVRAYPANGLGSLERLGVYLGRWGEFLGDEPRAQGFEGGVFPAIFGTVLMTLILCCLVLPFGVLAALYLREYAKAGPLISAVRIAVNNLAGVPSIVFGVFGLGFFCYLVGGSIDSLLFAARLPEPTFGTGGLLWASVTLALLTLPVVIVATEEALAAVPSSMREGSYGCGASQWQTIRRIVLPRALPGIMTGAILAMARGAGEVAPLMLVGAVKLAPELPLDLAPPFGINRSFMHLGFHIYDLGFQSQNAEAAKPMVYTTTLLLIAIIALLNLTAIFLRQRLHRKFVGGQL